MLRTTFMTAPRRVLMTLDAVGGVWTYATNTAALLARHGVACKLLGFGPPPSRDMRRTVEAIPGVELVWTGGPLDWMVTHEGQLADVGGLITDHVDAWRPDLLHLAAPSQAVGLPRTFRVVVQSHSCMPSWWAAVRDCELPLAWRWQTARNRAGFERADVVVVPSISHGAALSRLYGTLPHLRIVPNATARVEQAPLQRQSYVFAVGRWWDEGKGGSVLDLAAASTPWPVLMAGALIGPNGDGLVPSHAIALGHLPAADIGMHMARAALFAAPSRYEPFGLAVLEAACCGIPLLLGDIDTFRELWSGAAVFVDPKDPAAWAAAIGTLARDAAWRATLGHRALARAGTFSFDSQLMKLLGAYDAALQRRPAPVAACA